MDNEQIKQKIVAETTALMPLKVDNEEVIKYKFRHIQTLVTDLQSEVAEERAIYSNAFNLMQAAINEEYKQFSESVNYEEKEQILIQIKHKATEVCEILQAS
ncbi:hypothetical protein GCM10028808_50340 [Spirosoma migulaei]